MSEFKLREFLTENKLTQVSRLMQEVEEEIKETEEIEESEETVNETEEIEESEEIEEPEEEFDPADEREDSKYDGYVTRDMGGDPDMYQEQELDVSKYIGLGTAENILREIESDIHKVTMEAKLSRLREVMAAIDQKVTGLEEDTSLAGFLSTSKLKEMRRINKNLRRLEEKITKEYEKRYGGTK